MSGGEREAGQQEAGQRKPGATSGETRRTVIVAGAANVFVGVIKLAAGLLTGSSAMLAERDSAADTLNQAFLLTSPHAANARPSSHPFGDGQERYFWSLLAAFGIFVAAGGFSIFEGILALGHEGWRATLHRLHRARPLRGVAEGTSLTRAYSADAQRGPAQSHRARRARAAQPGHHREGGAVRGPRRGDRACPRRRGPGAPPADRVGGVGNAAASMAIGALLIVVAVKLGIDSRDLLIGRAAHPDEQRLIREEIEAEYRGLSALIELLTMHLGPDHLLIAARVDFSGDLTGDEGGGSGQQDRRAAGRPAERDRARLHRPDPEGWPGRWPARPGGHQAQVARRVTMISARLVGEFVANPLRLRPADRAVRQRIAQPPRLAAPCDHGFMTTAACWDNIEADHTGARANRAERVAGRPDCATDRLNLTG